MVDLVRVLREVAIPEVFAECVVFPPYSNPITDPMDPTVACNDDGSSGPLQLTTTVKAGSPITAYWNQIWPHAQGPMVRRSSYVIPPESFVLT